MTPILNEFKSGRTYLLKYHPIPRDRRKEEYIIGEAFLRYKGVSEQDLITLKNVDDDPPDLVFTMKGFGELRIEVTRFEPHDIGDTARRWKFIESLRLRLNQLGTKAVKPSNIFIHKEGLFPILKPKDVETIALEIDRFFKRGEFVEKYQINQVIRKEPIEIIFSPALKTMANHPTFYENNILIHDITGIPIDAQKTIQAIERIVQKKKSQTMVDILVIWQQILGMLALENTFNQMKELLLSRFPFEGIYILTIIVDPTDYWIGLVTIREHPIFQSEGVFLIPNVTNHD